LTEELQGYTSWTTPKGYKVIRLHHTADNEKQSEEWKAAMLDSMPDLASFLREIDIDWSASSGISAYPLFQSYYAEDPEWFVKEFELDPVPAPIYRGWDFGYRNPACIWAQISSNMRVKLYRELMPTDVDPHAFRDLVMYLSGQIGADDSELRRRPKALSYIEKFSEEGPVPWFPPGYSFIDFSGLEVTHTSKIFSEVGERTQRDVLASRGIIISALPQLVSAGETILRRLFQPFEDGKAGIWFKRDGTPRPGGFSTRYPRTNTSSIYMTP
jgi:hypothetical protein